MAINVTSLTTSGQTTPTTTTPQVFAGGSLTFSISATATGGAAITYLWQVSSNGGVSWNNLPNNGNSSITVTNIAVTQNGDQIRCELTANSGAGGTQETVYSDTATPNGHAITLTVLTPPQIFVNDSNQPQYTVATGSTLNLTVEATVTSTLSQFNNQNSANIDTELTFQWQQSTDNGVTFTNVVLGSNLSVNTTLLAFGTTPESYYKRSTLSLSNIAFSQNLYRYRCLISYTKDGTSASNSPVSTNAVTILVNPQIVVTKQPGQGTDTTSVISYNPAITGSGRATLSVTAYTSATSAISYQWSYTLDQGQTYIPFETTNPQIGNPPLQLLTGTNSIGPILELERLVISNANAVSRYGFRVIISGTAGETALTSDTAFVNVTQSASGLITDPVDQSVIEDKYGNVANRSSYPELTQTATFSAAVDVNAPNGLRGGPITLQWQRKYNGSSTFENVGVPKIVFGTDDLAGGSTNPNSPGVYDYETVPLRRDLDHLSQYRLSVTYPTGTTGVNDTIFSNPATLNVFRTAYIDNNPTSINAYNRQNGTLVVTASPSSGTTISYQWQHSSNGSNWFNLPNTVPLSVTSITRSNYTVTVTCASAHGFSAGNLILIEGSTDTAYNGTYTVLSTGLSANTFQYTAFSIPSTSPAAGSITVSSAPKYLGALTNTLSITPIAAENMPRRYFRCIITVPDSLSTVITGTALITILTDSFFQISSINDRAIFQFNNTSWTVTANSLSLGTVYYQWQKNTVSSAITSPNWVDISGANTATYQIVNAQPADAGFYRCKVISSGQTVSQTNAARLTVFPVALNISRNIPTSITVLENSINTSFTVAATSTNGNIVEYLWEVKPPGSSTFQTLPAGYNQSSAAFAVYNLLPLSRTIDNGSVIRCRMNALDVPGFTYSNECTITVDRRFYYFADAATKTIPVGQEVTFNLQPTFTGDDVPSYQWQSRPNSSAGWTNISGETNSSYTILSTNVVAGLNNTEIRCLVTFNQVTTFQYFRNGSTVIQNISPAGTPTPTQTIVLNVTTAIPRITFYSKQRQKSGAAIGTVICVPKPAGYVNDPSANTDDADRWKVALTGQTAAGAPVQGVGANTRPYGPNDRFPGFIEMRGQILKARDFPELARIMGTQYGGTITGTYPTYNINDTFRLPSPYGMKIMGTGNVDNNRASASVVPLYGPNSVSGGAINIAGSMGGVYNFEKLPQLPPGSPGDGSGADGISSDTFTIGTHRTDGWENCTASVETTFNGQFTWQVSDNNGIGERDLGAGPPHQHIINTIRATGGRRGAGGSGSAAQGNGPDGGNILDGPEGVPSPGRTHKHGLSFTGGTIVYTPPGGGGDTGGASGDISYSSPGTYSFVLPSNVTSFTYSLKSGAGGGGGNDNPNPGAPGGSAAEATGTINNIPPGTAIAIKIGAGGGGGTGCAANGAGGTGGNSGGTGFGGGTGGTSGSSGCSGSGGGGGGTSFMYIETLGSGANPSGLQRGDILVIVGGGGGGGGSGHHGGTTSTTYPGGNAGGGWASSSINSSIFYTNQAGLVFRTYDGSPTSSVQQSGRTGQNRNDAGSGTDGGGGGGGGGGFNGGPRGTVRLGCRNNDCNSNGGSAGSSAYRSSNHSGTPSITTAGGAGTSNTSGAGGSVTISYSGATTVPPTNPGGSNSADHGTGIGTNGAAFLTQTIDLHNDQTSTAPSMGLSINNGQGTMSTRSRNIWDSAYTFYLRNNEVCPMIQPYFRLKYLIKAF